MISGGSRSSDKGGGGGGGIFRPFGPQSGLKIRGGARATDDVSYGL